MLIHRDSTLNILHYIFYCRNYFLKNHSFSNFWVKVNFKHNTRPWVSETGITNSLSIVVFLSYYNLSSTFILSREKKNNAFYWYFERVWYLSELHQFSVFLYTRIKLIVIFLPHKRFGRSLKYFYLVFITFFHIGHSYQMEFIFAVIKFCNKLNIFPSYK